MVEESQLKYWRDAGHVARRALEAMKLELQPGKTFHEIIESAERFIHRHGGKPRRAAGGMLYMRIDTCTRPQ